MRKLGRAASGSRFLFFILALLSFRLVLALKSNPIKSFPQQQTKTKLQLDDDGCNFTENYGSSNSDDFSEKLREVTARLYVEPPHRTWKGSTMSAPIIEKKFNQSKGGSTVLERPAPLIHKEGATDSPRLADKFKVLLFNDDGNTREFIARSLVQIFGMSEGEAYKIMTTAHKTGMAVVGIWHLELAESYRDQLTARGILSEVVPVDDSN